LFRTENEQMKALTKEQREKIRSLKNQVFKYQTTYHDIDIGELHRKLQYFESECDVLSRLTTRQAQHLEHMKLNNEKMRAKLKLFKDRERRDQEAAEAALREAQDMADAAASGAGIKQVNKVKPRRSNMNLLGGKGAGAVGGTKREKESDEDSMFDDDFGGEVPTYKKAIRDQYERAINNYAQDSEFYKKNF